jgi:hypothetical protein
MYRKLKRVWSHNSFTYIPNFEKTFPELKNVDYEEMCRRFQSLGIDFYTEEKSQVKKLVRLTLPFAVILMILMFIGLPFAFFITGKWSYGIASKSKIYNWFRSLRLLS